MTIQTLLSRLAAEMGLLPFQLQLDPQGDCALRFPGDVQVDLHYAEAADALCLAAEVGPIDPDDRARVVPQLLRLNLDPRPLGEAQFALRDSRVVLCRTLSVESLGVERLAGELARLIANCGHWRQRLGHDRLALV
jgi:hypothetical protein